MTESVLVQPHRETRLRTLEEAQQWFVDCGVAVSEWAIERQFNPSLVYAVLHGRRQCKRGQSHNIAVALGLKATGAPVAPEEIN